MLGTPSTRYRQIPCPVRTLFLICRYCCLAMCSHRGETGHVSDISFCMEMNPFMKWLHSHNLIYLWKATAPNAITLGIRASTYECWEDTNIQSIAMTFTLRYKWKETIHIEWDRATHGEGIARTKTAVGTNLAYLGNRQKISFSSIPLSSRTVCDYRNLWGV